ncbi:Sphingosine N-acyltransferase lag1 [Exophiala dermatitidis]|uniref:Acyl-CoA-dependent ceramide synthase n=2 Tax=Exophiala dermatitidis TaxID=5970 RepID=H6C601_EXODN|nr:acyl-CoA-dependent ceramide synthase [Exophiala dermatitidis NIH/UT8656]KAJ4516253.1 Sphingosine N-acyltransferase lag1 [Exophiala dermatitidis]EHY59147.1 acyl-CoA-dependent ceramide synthase [Exophiala dermatitidis NIH/UT8656]KAJ4523064.1 Sphingosine N-acyltransferase lag1 [Exophiala dermatitidis]KAJ4526388.1 Sphingosine N-acyltransferase lag1 [Exophiala dermatitidis]KAJ4532368.1 Sphingosine N-acyltransferase lag1 [Exophiala dermatitidis]
MDCKNLKDQEKLERICQSTTNRRPHNETPSQKTAWPRWHERGKQKSSVALACAWVVDHQIAISANLISMLFFVHIFFPSARHHTQKFFRISYYNPLTGMFALGWDDIFFVFYWIIVFSGLRCAVMDYFLAPLASALGIKKKKPKVRFAEQAWLLLYYSISWSVGMYTMYTSDYWLDLRALWRNWPVREMEGLAKWYYLVQFGFYLQQIVVVNIEERRKDYLQMFVHHIITCCLIFTSYGYHQYRVGTLIMSLMDIVDVILPLAKTLKYLHFNVACDIAFGVFMVTWFVTRHVLYIVVLYGIYAHIPQEIRYGCYKGSVLDLQGPLPIPDDWDHLTQPFRDPVGLVCWNNKIKWAFLLSLFALQVVLLVWFAAIIRVAYKVITGQGAEDVRSDDEDDEEEDEDNNIRTARAPHSAPENKANNYIDSVQLCVEPHHETEILSTDPTFSLSNSNKSSSRAELARSTSSSSGRRKLKPESAHASGVNRLAASSDRKELLGRIGCDKGTASD